MYAWASGGVASARLFRVEPGRTPCYRCVRNAEPNPIGTTPREDGGLEFVWNGANFNLEMVAAAATRMAVQTLIGSPVDGRNPDHLVLELGGAVPRSRTISIERDTDCEVCGG